jgi:hypothetical protein
MKEGRTEGRIPGRKENEGGKEGMKMKEGRKFDFDFATDLMVKI